MLAYPGNKQKNEISQRKVKLVKKNMRGAFAAGAIALTAMLTFSGCASDPKPTTDVLDIWVDKLEAVALEGSAAKFEEETGIKINLVIKEGDPIEDFKVAGPAGEGPDVILGAHDKVGALVADGLVAPIDLGSKKGDFRENAIAAFTYDSNLYGMPYTIENIALVCNTEKVPAQPTWEELKKVGVALSLNGGTGDPYHMYSIQTSFGSKVFKRDADGNYTSELDMANGGAEFANWLATEGAEVLDPESTWDSSVAALADGTKACWITGPWAQGAGDGAIDLKSGAYSIYSIPSVGGQDSVQFMGSRGFYISSYATDKLYAQKFVVDYVGTEEVQTAMFEAGGRIPAHKAAFEAASEDPIVKGFGAAGVKAEPMPAIPAMAAVWSAWGATEIAILQKKGDPAELWTKMIADIEAAIAG